MARRVVLAAFAATALGGLGFGHSPAQSQVQWLFRAPKDFVEIDQVIAQKFPTVPHMSTGELALAMDRADRSLVPLLVDTRARAEYDVSHLAGAVSAPDLNSARMEIARARSVNPQRPVVLYCSVGYRSADLLAQLQKLPDTGYSANVKNLKGSLFQWANEGRSMVRTTGDAEAVAKTVHPYSAKWAHLLQPALRAPF